MPRGLIFKVNHFERTCNLWIMTLKTGTWVRRGGQVT